jgi:hypothetical protein
VLARSRSVLKPHSLINLQSLRQRQKNRIHHHNAFLLFLDAGFNPIDRPFLEAMAANEEDFLAQWSVEDPCFFRTALRPRQQQPPPAPVMGDRWAWIRGRVVNASGTYHSYSRHPGVSSLPLQHVLSHTNTSQGGQHANHLEGERVYERQADGTLRWFAFVQQAVRTLAGSGNRDLPRIQSY